MHSELSHPCDSFDCERLNALQAVSFVEKPLDASTNQDFALLSQPQTVEAQSEPCKFQKFDSIEAFMQTDGFTFPLSGPFYIGSHGPSLSDEKLLEACVGFMHLRAEFLHMLGFGCFPGLTEPIASLHTQRQKRRQKLLTPLRKEQAMDTEEKLPANSSIKKHSLYLPTVKCCNLDARSNECCDVNKTHSSFFRRSCSDEETRASGVPMIFPVVNHGKDSTYSQSISSKIHGSMVPTRPFSSRNPAPFPNASEINKNSGNDAPVDYAKKKSLQTEHTNQNDNGATPGRPRMNRSDFACTLCQTRNTPQWRYLEFEPVCNACYMRARKLQRSPSMQNCSYSGIKLRLGRFHRQKRERTNSVDPQVRSSAAFESTGTATSRLDKSLKYTKTGPNEHASCSTQEVFADETLLNDAFSTKVGQANPEVAESPDKWLHHLKEKENSNEISELAVKENATPRAKNYEENAELDWSDDGNI